MRPLEILVLTEPKQRPRSGPPSARYQAGRGSLIGEALLSSGHRPVMWWDHPEGPSVAEDADVVLLRSGRENQLDRAQLLAASGVPVISRPEAHRSSRDKLFQAAAFERAGVAHPETAKGGAPLPSGDLLAKPRRGSSGDGVRRIDREAALAIGVDELVQELLVPDVELRCTVIGERALAWASKQPAPGDFRGNIDAGATMTAAPEPADRVTEAAVAATRALGLLVGGVDLLVVDGEPVVLEVNAASTLHGPDEASTAAVLAALVELIERSVG